MTFTPCEDMRAPGAPDVGSAASGVRYEDFFPYYAEFSALSEFRKKPGCGIEISSGMGGHSILYLNGVKVDRSTGYPILRLCRPNEAPEKHGTGISVNSHYRNANWVAVEGREFLMRGALGEEEPLTRLNYAKTQARAREMGILEGIEFHPRFFRNKPPGMSKEEYMYEISVATDYGVRFGRNAYSARVPLDSSRMGAVVEYLNALNHPYREGKRLYNWKLFNNNCVHVCHNALAHAGVWAPWPTGQAAVVAAFRFPVPKNTFVDLMLRTNDLPIEDPLALYADPFVRETLLRWGTLPVGAGGLATSEPVILRNEIYDVARTLKLIFYDNPFWGPYRLHFRRIFTDLRYTDLKTNLCHFAARYAVSPGCQDLVHASFSKGYGEHVSRAASEVSAMLIRLGDAA